MDQHVLNKLYLSSYRKQALILKLILYFKHFIIVYNVYYLYYACTCVYIYAYIQYFVYNVYYAYYACTCVYIYVCIQYFRVKQFSIQRNAC